jgi:hypothetical protein
LNTTSSFNCRSRLDQSPTDAIKSVATDPIEETLFGGTTDPTSVPRRELDATSARPARFVPGLARQPALHHQPAEQGLTLQMMHSVSFVAKLCNLMLQPSVRVCRGAPSSVRRARAVAGHSCDRGPCPCPHVARSGRPASASAPPANETRTARAIFPGLLTRLPAHREWTCTASNRSTWLGAPGNDHPPWG